MALDQNYRDKMEFPMEELAAAMFGVCDQGEPMEDHEIVSKAAAKINMLKQMILATGMSKGLLDAAMKY